MNNTRYFAQMCVNSTELDSEMTFDSLRKKAKALYNTIENEKTVIKKEIEKVNANYKGEELNRRLNEIEESKPSHTVAKDNLVEDLNKIVDAKRKQLAEYTLKPTDDEIQKILDNARVRSNTLSGVEIDMLIDRCSGNYSALAQLRDILESMGKTLYIPFDPEEMSQRLDNAQKLVTRFIDDIESSDQTYYAFAYYCSDSDLPQLKGLDTDPSVMIGKEQPTLYQKIEDAINESMSNGDVIRAKRLIEARDKYAGSIMTDDEKIEEVNNIINE